MREGDRLAEERLNRLLRRADWRFLLPNPWPEKIAASVEGLLRHSLPLLGSEIVDLRPGRPGDCDLVVLQNPDRKQLATASQALRPGGSLYVEHSRPTIGGSPAVRKRLEQAGFSQVATYWAWPFPERGPSIFWLPLEAPLALDYFLQRRPRSVSLPDNVRRGLLRFFWGFLRRIQLIAPLSAVAVKPGSDGQAKQPDLARLISDNWQVDGPGDHLSQFEYLLLTGGLRSINKTALLVFARGEKQPGLVVKMPRVPESIPLLAQEAANLEGMRFCWGGRLPGVPRVRFYSACPPFAALGEEALDGEPLQTRLRRDNFPQLAAQATNWLVKLAKCSPAKVCGDWWGRLGEPALTEFERKFGPVLTPGELERAAGALVSLGELPEVSEQRDFSPWNVLIDRHGELVVLDWESAELRGLPCLDLVYFLTFLSFFVDGAMDSKRYLDSFRGQLDHASFTGKVVQECQLRYSQSLNLPPSVLPPLRLFAWTVHALSEYQRLVEDRAGEPGKSDLESSLFLQLWREELHRMTLNSPS